MLHGQRRYSTGFGSFKKDMNSGMAPQPETNDVWALQALYPYKILRWILSFIFVGFFALRILKVNLFFLTKLNSASEDGLLQKQYPTLWSFEPQSLHDMVFLLLSPWPLPLPSVLLLPLLLPSDFSYCWLVNSAFDVEPLVGFWDEQDSKRIENKGVLKFSAYHIIEFLLLVWHISIVYAYDMFPRTVTASSRLNLDKDGGCLEEKWSDVGSEHFLPFITERCQKKIWQLLFLSSKLHHSRASWRKIRGVDLEFL